MALATAHNGDQLLRFVYCAAPTPLADHPDLPITFACVVASHTDGVLFVYNPWETRREWELPAGGINAGETALEAAHRELLEESNQVCASLQCVGMALLWIARKDELELGAMFAGDLDVLQTFRSSDEANAIMLWDLRSPTTDEVNALGHKLAELILQGGA